MGLRTLERCYRRVKRHIPATNRGSSTLLPRLCRLYSIAGAKNAYSSPRRNYRLKMDQLLSSMNQTRPSGATSRNLTWSRSAAIVFQTLPSQNGEGQQDQATPEEALSASRSTVTASEQGYSSAVTAPSVTPKTNQTASLDTSRESNFRIPEQTLQDAITSNQTSGANDVQTKYWEYGMFLGGNNEKPIVHYCRKKDKSEKVAQHFLGQKILGFDLEWKPNVWHNTKPKDGVSLIQLASENRVALFHLALHYDETPADDMIAPTLRRILESPEITKVGVAVRGDATRLRKHYGVETRGLFELSHVQNLLYYLKGDIPKLNKKLCSLSNLVQEHYNLELAKEDNVRSSDWTRELNITQITYAATDAYAGLQLFKLLDEKRRALHPTPPLPYHAELELPIRISDSEDEVQSSPDIFGEEDDSLDDDSDELMQSASVAGKSAVRTRAAAAKAKSVSLSTDSSVPGEILAANVWVEDFRRSLPDTPNAKRPNQRAKEATPSSLRAYALWHHQAMDAPEIAKLLRDPPLKVTTVCSYVLTSLVTHDLPFEQDRALALLELVDRHALPGLPHYRRFLKSKAEAESS